MGQLTCKVSQPSHAQRTGRSWQNPTASTLLMEMALRIRRWTKCWEQQGCSTVPVTRQSCSLIIQFSTVHLKVSKFLKSLIEMGFSKLSKPLKKSRQISLESFQLILIHKKHAEVDSEMKYVFANLSEKWCSHINENEKGPNIILYENKMSTSRLIESQISWSLS